MDHKTYLQGLKRKLLKSNNWQAIILTRSWVSNIPSLPGVYVFKEGEEIIYVGETGNLNGRMTDLLDSRHHTIRRSIGKKLFSNQKGFVQATSKQKFPSHIEEKINEYIHNRLSLAFISVSLGRKELEEYIEGEIRQDLKLNKRGKRK
jgi:hypothetical protein